MSRVTPRLALTGARAGRPSIGSGGARACGASKPAVVELPEVCLCLRFSYPFSRGSVRALFEASFPAFLTPKISTPALRRRRGFAKAICERVTARGVYAASPSGQSACCVSSSTSEC
jgi:hypothetical protein